MKARAGVLIGLVLLGWPHLATTQVPDGSPTSEAHVPDKAAPPSTVAPPNPATVVAGPRYEAGTIRRWLLGGGHRDLWLTPVTVPVLDISTFEGGLVPTEQGGGNQSVTLHFEAPDGREFVFRSVDKHLDQGYPEDLQDTYIGDQIQDVISALYPASALVVAELLDHTGILHVHPVLYVMPDDPKLGEFRETFAGMLGIMELTPDEGEDGQLRFEGSGTIKGTDEFLEDLNSDPSHQLNTRRYLKARLFDLMINDTDRGGDQWRWAQYERGDGYIWEPIPRDRDWAFVHAGGLLVKAGASIYPKVVKFEPDYPSLTGLTIQAWELDRRLLAGLDWEAWSETIDELRLEITDQVIASSLLALPEPWRLRSEDQITEVLRARRDALGAFAREYYELLAFEADVRGTEGAERGEIERLAGGDVRLRLYAEGESVAHFDRVFLEDDTREVRLYLAAGDDAVRVSGEEDDGAVILRIVGGDGDDAMRDEGASTGWKTRTAFYDSNGDNRLEGTESTLISEAAYERPAFSGTFVSARLQSEPRDWGGGSSLRPFLSYGEAAGVILGGSWTRKRLGFRTDPYRYSAKVTLKYATRSGRFGGAIDWSNRFTTNPLRLDVGVRVTQLESFRFFGYGNDVPFPEGDLSFTVVDEDMVVDAAVMGVLELGVVDVGLGPVLRYTDLRPREDSELTGGPGIARVGGRATLTVPPASSDDGSNPVVQLELKAEAFPAVWDLEDPLVSVDGVGETRLPIPIGGTPPSLILRAGGRHVWGDVFPVDESAFIGGAATLRGYRFSRFAGRSSAFGSAEVRLPLLQLEILTRGRLGVLAFQDVGRVWWDEDEPSQWHSGHGGGLWFESLGLFVSGEIARGEETRYYLGLEWPF